MSVHDLDYYTLHQISRAMYFYIERRQNQLNQQKGENKQIKTKSTPLPPILIYVYYSCCVVMESVTDKNRFPGGWMFCVCTCLISWCAREDYVQILGIHLSFGASVLCTLHEYCLHQYSKINEFFNLFVKSSGDVYVCSQTLKTCFVYLWQTVIL